MVGDERPEVRKEPVVKVESERIKRVWQLSKSLLDASFPPKRESGDWTFFREVQRQEAAASS